MIGTATVEISTRILTRLEGIHNKYRDMNLKMSEQDINYMLWRLIENEESRLGMTEDKPFPKVGD